MQDLWQVCTKNNKMFQSEGLHHLDTTKQNRKHNSISKHTCNKKWLWWNIEMIVKAKVSKGEWRTNCLTLVKRIEAVAKLGSRGAHHPGWYCSVVSWCGWPPISLCVPSLSYNPISHVPSLHYAYVLLASRSSYALSSQYTLITATTRNSIDSSLLQLCRSWFSLASETVWGYCQTWRSPLHPAIYIPFQSFYLAFDIWQEEEFHIGGSRPLSRRGVVHVKSLTGQWS